MKTIPAFLIMIVCGAALFAQPTTEPQRGESSGSVETVETKGEAKMENKGVFSTIIDGFADSTRTIHEINKENIAAVKEETKTNFEAATAPNAGLVKLNETKGFWNKIKVIFNNIIESANANTEKENLRRAEIQSHSSYRTILEEQRTNRQSRTAY